jgi:hypothetical protein
MVDLGEAVALILVFLEQAVLETHQMFHRLKEIMAALPQTYQQLHQVKPAQEEVAALVVQGVL